MRIIRFVAEDGRVLLGEDHADGSATVLLDADGVLGPRQAEAANREVLRGKHALVADDDEGIRHVLTETLSRVECACTVCKDGAEAVAAIAESNVDVVISDIMMPSADGYEVFAAARRRRGDLPVVLVTGYGYDPSHTVLRATTEGCEAVLYKPFTPQQLLSKVSEVIRGGANGHCRPLVRTSERVSARLLLAPVTPRDILCVGRNYPAPGAGAAAIPLGPGGELELFMKPRSSVQDPLLPIRLPPAPEGGPGGGGGGDDPGVDVEGELAVIIGRVARGVSEDDAARCIFGYVAANDVTDRRWQRPDLPMTWMRGKGFDTFCPIGPAVVTADEIPSVGGLTICTMVNGRVVRRARAGGMIRSVPKLISEISARITLYPGTLVLTGAPPRLEPSPPGGLRPGDEVCIEIDSIGRLVNTIAAPLSAAAALFLVLALSAAAPAPPAAPPAAPAAPPVAALGLTAAETAWLAAHPVIRLGPYANYAPAQFVDADGTHRGIAAEYVALIETMLGLQFESVPTQTWQEILDKARVREIDVIALAADTEDRRAYLKVTQPYLDLPAVIIARVGVEERLTTRDLAGMRVAVVRGYAVHDWLAANHPALELDLVPDTRTGLRKVSFGIDDAMVSDLAVASHAIDAEGIVNLRVVGESGFIYRMGFAARSDWPELTAILDKALAQVSPQQRQEIHDRWISLSRETEFASRRTHWAMLAALAAAATLAAAVLLWNRTLRRRVEQRTAELGSELTERRRAVEALRSSEERIRAIIGTALDAIITMDAAGNVSGWSDQAERTFGWTRDEALGKPLAELIVPPRLREEHRRGLARFQETGEGAVLNLRFETAALARDGREIPVEISIAPMRRNGTSEFSAFVRDITQRKQSEAELERHRNRLEELVVQRTAALCEARDVAESARADLSERVRELEAAMSEVRRLRGLLPVCSYCHRIREGEAYTKSVEAYLAEHSTARFSHGVCPDCYEQYVRPQLEEL